MASFSELISEHSLAVGEIGTTFKLSIVASLCVRLRQLGHTRGEFRVSSFEFRVSSFEFRVSSFEFRVRSFEFRVSSSEF